MDYTVILAALITGVCAVIGQYLISRKNRRDADIKREIIEAKREDWEQRVEHKLDVHNAYADKFGDIAVELAEIKTEIRNLKEFHQ
ncbi:MAG: hypothetical protein J6S63_00945 [Atopobiaceae bacterium]|nr:hypothetical protein [Atopobiaceae bacterium]